MAEQIMLPPLQVRNWTISRAVVPKMVWSASSLTSVLGDQLIQKYVLSTAKITRETVFFVSNAAYLED